MPSMDASQRIDIFKSTVRGNDGTKSQGCDKSASGVGQSLMVVLKRMDDNITNM